MSIDWNQIIIAIIPALGVLAGVGLSEYFKRKDRESLFSEVIFKKKLKVYEELFYKLNKIGNKADEIVNDTSLSKKERHEIWSEIVLSFASFLDRNELYLNENIKLHAAISVVGVEEIPDMNEEEKKDHMRDFNQDIRKAMEMIKEEIGIKRLDRFFGKLNKSDLESRWTEYVNEIKKEKEI